MKSHKRLMQSLQDVDRAAKETHITKNKLQACKNCSHWSDGACQESYEYRSGGMKPKLTKSNFLCANWHFNYVR